MHILGLIACIYNNLPVEIRAVLLICICLSWIITIRRNEKITSDYLEIECRNGNQWSLQEQDAPKFNATLLSSTVNTASVVFLHLDLGSAGKRYLMICRNQLEQEQFRQLRVALKISSSEQ